MSVPAAYIGVILIWATTPLAIKWSGEAGYLLGVMARMGIGLTLCAILVLLLREELPLERKALRSYLAAGLGIFGAMLSTYWGAQYIPSGLISVLFGLTPLVSGVMAAVWLGEPAFSGGRLPGMLFGFAGLAIIFLHGQVLPSGTMAGMGALMLAVFIHSASMVWVKRIGGHLSPLSMNTGALLVAVPLFSLSWLLYGPELAAVPPNRVMGAIVYLGVFGTTLGFILYFYTLKHLSTGAMAMITVMTPVLALILGHRLNGEPLSGQVWVGTAFITLGLLSYQWGGRLKRWMGA